MGTGADEEAYNRGIVSAIPLFAGTVHGRKQSQQEREP